MKIIAWVGVGYIHSREVEMEIDDEDLEGMDEEETERYVNEVVWDYVSANVVEWGWRRVE